MSDCACVHVCACMHANEGNMQGRGSLVLCPLRQRYNGVCREMFREIYKRHMQEQRTKETFSEYMSHEIVQFHTSCRIKWLGVVLLILATFCENSFTATVCLRKVALYTSPNPPLPMMFLVLITEKRGQLTSKVEAVTVCLQGN